VILLVKMGKNGQKTQKSVFEVNNIHLPDIFFQKQIKSIILNLLLIGINNKKYIFPKEYFLRFYECTP